MNLSPGRENRLRARCEGSRWRWDEVLSSVLMQCHSKDRQGQNRKVRLGSFTSFRACARHFRSLQTFRCIAASIEKGHEQSRGSIDV